MRSHRTKAKNPQLSELSLAQSKIVFADRDIHLENDRYQPHPNDKQPVTFEMSKNGAARPTKRPFASELQL